MRKSGDMIRDQVRIISYIISMSEIYHNFQIAHKDLPAAAGFRTLDLRITIDRCSTN